MEYHKEQSRGPRFLVLIQSGLEKQTTPITLYNICINCSQSKQHVGILISLGTQLVKYVKLNFQSVELHFQNILRPNPTQPSRMYSQHVEYHEELSREPWFLVLIQSGLEKRTPITLCNNRRISSPQSKASSTTCQDFGLVRKPSLLSI